MAEREECDWCIIDPKERSNELKSGVVYKNDVFGAPKKKWARLFASPPELHIFANEHALTTEAIVHLTGSKAGNTKNPRSSFQHVLRIDSRELGTHVTENSLRKKFSPSSF